MRHPSRAVLIPLLATLSLVPSACSGGGPGDEGGGGGPGGGGGSTSPVVEQLVGANGAVLVISEGSLSGTALRVPPLSIGGEVTIRIAEGNATPDPDFVILGPAVELGPDEVRFNPLATLQLPYIPQLPTGRTIQDIVIKRRAEDGAISDLTPSSVSGAVALVELAGFSTYWVAIPAAGDPPPTDDVFSEFWPLGNGDRWDFEDGSEITVSDGTAPPLAGSTAVSPTFSGQIVTFRADGREILWYLRRESGGALLRNRESVDGELRAHDEHLFAPFTIRGGTIVNEGYDYGSFMNPLMELGSGTSAYQARFTRGTTTRIVPAGTFDDTYVVEFSDRWTQLAPSLANGSDRIEIVFARGVGPVLFRVDGGSEKMLRQWTVNGVRQP